MLKIVKINFKNILIATQNAFRKMTQLDFYKN